MCDISAIKIVQQLEVEESRFLPLNPNGDGTSVTNTYAEKKYYICLKSCNITSWIICALVLGNFKIVNE